MKKVISILGFFSLAEAQLVMVDPVKFWSNGECHGIKAEEECMQDTECVWCEAWAIPSACLSTEEASHVSDAVFECKKRGEEESFGHIFEA